MNNDPAFNDLDYSDDDYMLPEPDDDPFYSPDYQGSGPADQSDPEEPGFIAYFVAGAIVIAVFMLLVWLLGTAMTPLFQKP